MDDPEPIKLSIEPSQLLGLQRMAGLQIIPLSDLPPLMKLGTGDDNGLEYNVGDVGRDPKRHPFEVYITGYTTDAETTAKCQIAWGTVRGREKIDEIIPITDLDTTINLTSGEKVWLQVEFTVAGNVVTLSTCAVKKGTTVAGQANNGWSSYPNEMLYTDASNYKWFHLIAYVRTAKRGKDPLQSPTPNHPYPDSGEFPVIKTGLVIAQCTNTHLVAQQQCMMDYAVSPNLIRSAARLVPGPGGVI